MASITQRLLVPGRFPFVRTGWPDHCPTSRFDNEIRFFREFLPNNHFLGAYYLGFDWYGWRDLSKMEILIALGIVWPVSSDKWKAPPVSTVSARTPGTMTSGYDQRFRGVLTEKLGGGVRHASCNHYPISDQNLWFFLPYFRPDEKFETLFQTWSPVAEPGAWEAVTARTR